MVGHRVKSSGDEKICLQKNNPGLAIPQMSVRAGRVFLLQFFTRLLHTIDGWAIHVHPPLELTGI
jgi:hypothetical protein